MAKYTITVEVPAEADPGDWMFVSALLDSIEPGAAAHTLGVYRASDRGPMHYKHHRLGVDITVAEAY